MNIKIAYKYLNEYFIKVFRQHYYDFNGTANLKQFWFFILGILVCSFIFGLIAKILALLFTFAVMVPCVAITVRRVRDTGIDYRLGYLSALFYISTILNLLPQAFLNNWFIKILMALLSLLVFVSFVALLIFCIMPSKQ